MRHLICISSLWLRKSRTPGPSWLFTVSVLKKDIQLSWEIPKAFRYCSRTLWDGWMFFTRGEKNETWQTLIPPSHNPWGKCIYLCFWRPWACLLPNCSFQPSDVGRLLLQHLSPTAFWHDLVRTLVWRVTVFWKDYGLIFYFLTKNNYLGQNQTELG